MSYPENLENWWRFYMHQLFLISIKDGDGRSKFNLDHYLFGQLGKWYN